MSRPSPGSLPGPASQLSPDDGEELGFLFTELRRDLPEFVPQYLELAEACGDDPGEPLVLAELADFVASRLAVIGAEESALSRALAVVEFLLGANPGDDTDAELVGYAFFDQFTLEDRRLLTPRLGPHSLHQLESLEEAPRRRDW